MNSTVVDDAVFSKPRFYITICLITVIPIVCIMFNIAFLIMFIRKRVWDYNVMQQELRDIECAKQAIEMTLITCPEEYTDSTETTRLTKSQEYIDSQIIPAVYTGPYTIEIGELCKRRDALHEELRAKLRELAAIRTQLQ